MNDDDFGDATYSYPNADNLDEYVSQLPRDIRGSELYKRLIEGQPAEQNSDEISPLENLSSEHDLSEVSREDHSEEQHTDQDRSNEEDAEENHHNEDHHDENHSDDSGAKESLVDVGNEAEVLKETAIDHSKDLKHFTCFGKLPPELRVKIWRYTFPQTSIITLVAYNNHDIFSTQPPASVFHVCSESRKEAQKSFKWKFHTYVSRSEEIFFFEKISGLRALANLWRRHHEIGIWERINHAVIEWDVLATLLYEEFDQQLNDLILDILPETRVVTILVDPYMIRKGEVSLGDTCELYPEGVRGFIDRIEDFTNAWSDTPPSSPTTDNSQEPSNDEPGTPDLQTLGLRIEAKVIKRDGKSWPAIEVDPEYTDPDNYCIRLQTELWHQSLIRWTSPHGTMSVF